MPSKNGTQKVAAVRDTRPKPTFTGKARPHYVSDMDVLTAARARMRWIFDEFDGKVSVSCSGGKDSTVILELAAEVARERGEKLRVVFIDQEAEFQGTIDYMHYLQTREDINLEWYQVPFKLFNATNHENEWLQVWGPGEDWMRPMEPDSIKDLRFHDRRTGRELDRWMEIVDGVNRRTGDAILVGMRAEESPTRRVSMISAPAYKWITWSAGPGRWWPGDDEQPNTVRERGVLGDPTIEEVSDGVFAYVQPDGGTVRPSCSASGGRRGRVAVAMRHQSLLWRSDRCRGPGFSNIS